MSRKIRNNGLPEDQDFSKYLTARQWKNRLLPSLFILSNNQSAGHDQRI